MRRDRSSRARAQRASEHAPGHAPGRGARHRGCPRQLPVLLLYLVTLALVAAPHLAAAQEVPELKINSKRYIVIDADTGEVYAQRDAHDPAAMASLTKIFTAIEAIEAGSPELQITTTSADLVSPENSMMGFDAGETFSLEDLLFGLMLPSGNDAANAIARSLGTQPGDTPEQAVQRFVDRMNTRVTNMGLTETYLVNPSGWGVPDHHSSAHDLAVFTMYALQYPRFVKLISTLEYDAAAGGYSLRNNNRLLTMYPSLLGGKTGYDNDAGWCLIEVARRDGHTMISVTLDGIHPDDWYDDNRVLLEYAFEQKEQRLAADAPIAGEVVSFRDPDAAIIAQIATAGGSIGSAAPAAEPAESMAASAADPGPVVAPDRAATAETLVQGQTELNLRLLGAFIVAAVILAGRALFTFSQPFARAVAAGSGPARTRRLVWPHFDVKLERPPRKSDPAV